MDTDTGEIKLDFLDNYDFEDDDFDDSFLESAVNRDDYPSDDKKTLRSDDDGVDSDDDIETGSDEGDDLEGGSDTDNRAVDDDGDEDKVPDDQGKSAEDERIERLERELRVAREDRERAKLEQKERESVDQRRQRAVDFDRAQKQSDKELIDQFKTAVATGQDEDPILVLKHYTDQGFQQFLNFLPEFVDNQIQTALGQVANIAAGKRAFLNDPSFQDIHANVDEVADLVSRGYAPEDAIKMVRAIAKKHNPSGKQPNRQTGRRVVSLEDKRKAAEKTRKKTHLEAPDGTGTAGGKKKPSKKEVDAETKQMQAYWKRQFNF